MNDNPPPTDVVSWGYWRSASSPVETIAEKKLAARFGWDLPVVTRRRAVGNGNGGSGAYKLIAPEAFAYTTEPRFEVLRVAEWKRFGNAVRQLCNLFYVAERYGAKRLEFPKPHPYFAGTNAGPFRLAWERPLALPPEMRRLVPIRPGLEGDFYFLDGLGLRPDEAEQARIVATYLRPLLSPQLSAPHPEVGAGDVVLHFRAGDAFTPAPGQKMHPAYAQPPLAYYLAAVARERPSRVWIIFEDRSNPAVEAAEAALRSRGITVRMQSADLTADLCVLLNAPCLIASIGTFCPGIASLSARVRKFYHFGPCLPLIQHLGIPVVECVDVPGDYTRAAVSNNWSASSEQVAMMMSYPQSALGFIDRPALG